MLDQDGDGYITNEEFKKRYGFENETPSEMKGSKIHSGIWDDIDKLFMRIDKTGQSRINFDTFRSHMLELIEKGCYQRRIDFERETRISGQFQTPTYSPKLIKFPSGLIKFPSGQDDKNDQAEI